MELGTRESGLVDQVRQKGRSHQVYSMRGRASRSAGLQLEEAWDRHGRSVYALACALLGDGVAAAQAVTLGMTDLAGSTHSVSAADARRCMARHVYWRTYRWPWRGSADSPSFNAPAWRCVSLVGTPTERRPDCSVFHP
jgi:hypothetical protein